MRLRERILRSFIGNQYNDIYYHESGHVVLAKIFEESFRIEFITCDSLNSKKYDAESLGGMKGKAAKPSQDMTIYDRDAIIMILLAGIRTDDVNNNNGKITERLYETSNWAPKLSQERYSGDMERVAGLFPLIMGDLKIKWIEYVVITMRLLHKILLNDMVWDTVNSIRSELMKSHDSTLNQKQIDGIIANGNLSKWISENLSIIRIERENLFNKLP